MPAYEGSHSTVLRGTPEDAFAVLTDVEHLPDWQPSMRRAEVLDRYPDGLARDVEFEVDVKLRSVRYVLRHVYDEPTRIDSEYVRGDFETFEGAWTFTPRDDGTTEARFALRIDPGMRLPGPIVRMLRDRILKTAVEALRSRVESGARA